MRARTHVEDMDDEEKDSSWMQGCASECEIVRRDDRCGKA